MHEQHRSEPLRAPFWHLSVLHRLPPPHRCKGLASHHVQLLCRSLGAVNPLPRGRGFVRQVPCAAHIGFRLAVGFVAMRLLLSIFEPEPPSPLPEPESSSVNSESPSLLSVICVACSRVRPLPPPAWSLSAEVGLELLPFPQSLCFCSSSTSFCSSALRCSGGASAASSAASCRTSSASPRAELPQLVRLRLLPLDLVLPLLVLLRDQDVHSAAAATRSRRPGP